MISQILSAVATATYHVAPFYILIECLFFIVFRNYLVPRANRLVPPAPFRDYGNARSKLLTRIMRRIEVTCRMNQQDVAITIHKFLAEWFHVCKNEHHNQAMGISNFPDLAPTPMTSPENSDDEDSQQANGGSASNKDTNVPRAPELSVCLYKEDVDNFFAWAFFGKQHFTLLPWELKELDTMYGILKREVKIEFPKKPACPQRRQSESYHVATPRCMTLEPMNAIHRPLIVYLLVGFLKVFGGLLLRLLGYQRLVASTGLVAWYKQGKSGSHMPLLFFHGIAPGGLVLYLPMLLFGLATEPERPIFLFENRSISCSMDFFPLTEQQSVDGIMELVNQQIGTEHPVSVVGHSFGSCPIAWLVASEMSKRIHQVVLLDPVAILLSEPDVMVNFLYAQEMDKIRMVASSELFTEYYLRRHFAWYNSELWLEDLKQHQKVLVCLSEEDRIVNAKKVRQELERHESGTKHEKPTIVYWNNVGHGDCISSPFKWRQIKGLMLQQELEILQQSPR